MVAFYDMKKVHWNSINKKQNGLEQFKNEKSSTLPRWSWETYEQPHPLIIVSLVQFSWYRVTSALASVAISHRILFCALVVALAEKKEASSSMTIGNEELMQECFPEH